MQIFDFKDTQSHVYYLIFIDSVPTKGLDHICQKLSPNKDQELVIHIFGGYEDENETSEELSLDLFKYLVRSKFKFSLDFCVIGAFNTTFGDENTVAKYPRPMVYGVAYEVNTGKIFKADFSEKGPDCHLRHVRLSFRRYQNYDEYYEARDYLYEDFDNETGDFTIKPFAFRRSPDLQMYVKSPDQFLLENMSTSPKVEPKHFCANIKSAINLILDNPKPEQSIFPQNTSRRYTYSDADKKWIQNKMLL